MDQKALRDSASHGLMAVASTGYGMVRLVARSILLAACLTFALYKSGDQPHDDENKLALCDDLAILRG